MAYFERRGNRWRVQIRRKGAPPESATFHSRAQADEWARLREAELVGIRHGLAPRRSVRQAIEHYRDHVAPAHRGARWEVIRLDKIARELDWADRPLGGVSGDDVDSWVRSQRLALAPSSVRREYGILRAVFAAAVGWGWLRASPFAGRKPPPEGAPRKQRVSDADAAALCEALGWSGRRPETASQVVAAAFLWCIATAMRQGEALSLERSAVAGKVAHLDRTKNGDERDVPLRPAALALLELLPAEGYLFPVTSGTCDTLFRRARDACGLLHVRFHDSRREGTTRLASQVDVLTLAKITGHRDIKTLLKTYYQPSMDDVAERLA